MRPSTRETDCLGRPRDQPERLLPQRLWTARHETGKSGRMGVSVTVWYHSASIHINADPFGLAKNRSGTCPGKGPLCVALIVTRYAQERGLPLDPEKLVTKSGGQVRGLGKAAVQSVLRRHGIERVLAAEGGAQVVAA